MWRMIAGIVAGLVVWTLVVTVLNLGLRHGWPAYAAVEKSMAFTLPMMIARLSESAVSSIVSGWAAAALGKSRTSALIAGLIALALFFPVHYRLWHKFPVWYHLTFLVSLPVLSVAGGRLARISSAVEAA
ncbi:MAG TPA: hypothetical protein VLW75_02165 [Rhizomicrobium sp.]|nr:hypothetical protein [Rhizomicrobium sp.]